jgi:ketosteroid isomerase-like protein
MSMSAIDLVREVYDRGARRNVAGLLELVADDVVVTQDPSLPWGGRYVGRDGVIEFFTKLTTTLDSTVSTEVLFQAGDDVVQCGRSRGTIGHSGRVVDVPECHIWTIRDGTIAKAQFFIQSAAVLAAMNDVTAPTTTPN